MYYRSSQQARVFPFCSYRIASYLVLKRRPPLFHGAIPPEINVQARLPSTNAPQRRFMGPISGAITSESKLLSRPGL